MAEHRPGRSRIFSVPLGTDFSDAAADFVLAQSADPLAAIGATLLLPNNRAVQAMTAAFVRRASPGLLLPRMVAIGDLALDEALGPMLDPLDGDGAVPAAISPMSRIILLAELVMRFAPKGEFVSAAEALRLARKFAELVDELEIEMVAIDRLKDIAIDKDLAGHWQQSYGRILAIFPEYQKRLTDRNLLGPAARRNILLERFESRLRDHAPTGPIIAAGVTTGAPAVARLLRRVARIPGGSVLLPGVDLEMDAAEWEKLRPSGEPELPQAMSSNAEVHPQFHLKLLLDRMGVGRDEIEAWGGASAKAANGATIAGIFCMPEQSAAWRELPPARKRLPHVHLVEAADSAEEAKVIALQVRLSLEIPGRRIAVVTPDRELAIRVAAQLRRWGIAVDDSAGKPLAQTPEGTLIMALAEALSGRFSATTILEVAKHPLVHAGEDRLAWLNGARSLDIALRGPAAGVGLDAIGRTLAQQDKPDEALIQWWTPFSATLAGLASASSRGLTGILQSIGDIADELTSGNIWKGVAGRELSRLWEEITACDLSAIPVADDLSVPAVLKELLSGAVVRPPYGGHPRVAIFGLLEARMQQADTVVCAGLNETVWPQIAQPDPWLAPAVRRHLGLPTLERNIGLSAHDLATALGAKNVLLTRAKRDRGGPTVASRFLLRIKALLGGELQIDPDLPRYARLLDEPAERQNFAARPAMNPDAQQRRVKLSVTDFDQLKSDPYSFYSKRILRLKKLELVDADPSYAWRGTLVHDVLQMWFQKDNCEPDALQRRAQALLSDGNLDPLLRAFWQPCISEGLQWIAAETQRMRDDEGRQLLVAEQKGQVELLGIPISGRADRIDALSDGSLVVIDYKTGQPPKPKQLVAGFALQLGLVGLMAERGAIEGVAGKAMRFEYWSLAKDKNSFGHIVIANSVKPSDKKQAAEDFIAFAKVNAEDALNRWILGADPFTAKLKPEFGDYPDYDQLMRRQEWDGRQTLVEGGAS